MSGLTPFDRTTATRRTALGSLAAAVCAVGGAGVLSAGAGPAAAIDGDPVAFEAGETPTVYSNDGRIEAVYLTPEIDVRWRDFSGGLDSVEITVAVGTDAGVDVVYRETVTDAAETPGDVADVRVVDETVDGDADDAPGFDAVDGALAVTFDRIDATERGDAVTSARLSDGDLEAGEAAGTTIDVVLRADVRGADGDDETVVRTDAFDLRVENPDGDAEAGGNVNVDAA